MAAAIDDDNNNMKKKRRKVPFPNSILDRQALEQALDDHGITTLKRLHLDAFYQILHRQHYPDLKSFVETYYKHDRKEEEDEQGKARISEDRCHNHPETDHPPKPLKNAISKKKKYKNRIQLPKVFLDYLATTNDFVTVTSRVQHSVTSGDQMTTKFMVELWDGQVVESVLMRYAKKGQGRASLCVSSQCGCAMGCTFCATGTMGLSGNLTSAEILEQLIHANAILAKEYPKRLVENQGSGKKLDLVRNVVFMGMGEPLDNYDNVVTACRAMMDRRRWNLAHGHVTVSTVGLISQIRKLTRELPEVSLALSLHAPNQDLRTSIVPTATRYPIERLIDAIDDHMMANSPKPLNGQSYTKEERMKESSRRRAMIEYVMRKF